MGCVVFCESLWVCGMKRRTYEYVGFFRIINKDVDFGGFALAFDASAERSDETECGFMLCSVHSMERLREERAVAKPFWVFDVRYKFVGMIVGIDNFVGL